MCELYALTWATRAHNTGVTCIQRCVLNYVGMYITAPVPHCAIIGCLVWMEGKKRHRRRKVCASCRGISSIVSRLYPWLPLFCGPHADTENANFWHWLVQTNNPWCASLVFWMLFWQRTLCLVLTWINYILAAHFNYHGQTICWTAP